MDFRKLVSVDELKRVCELDERIWGMEPTPIDQTLTAAKNGGLIIGAFESNQLVGFSYGFPGYKAGEIYLCSHKLGVLPEYRDQSVGYQLKLQQAEMAKAIGYRLIRWTYDPLESRNAYLNIAKLGAVCHEYIENCYGEMSGKLNANLPSDRFNVDWHLTEHAHAARFVDEPLTREDLEDRLLLNWRSRANGLPEPVYLPDATDVQDLNRMSSTQGRYPDSVRYVPIPRNFQALKQNDFALATEWRMATRAVFERAFAAGWTVTGIARYPSDSVQLYVLSKEEDRRDVVGGLPEG